MPANESATNSNTDTSRQIEFAEPVIGEAEIERVTDTLRSGWLTTGDKVEQFESRIANHVGAKYGVGTTNCTSALYLTHRGFELSGEIITSPMTFATTVSSIELAGATPVLADVRPDTLTLDPHSVLEAISDDTEAIVPVHYAGQATDMDIFTDIAEDYGLVLIEDAAHGLGGFFRGEPLGTIGQAGCFSFYATKSITTGEGGIIVTDDEELTKSTRRLRSAGVDKSAWEREDQDDPDWYYDVKAISGKYNMNNIQASLGLAQLDRLETFIDTRRELASQLDDGLSSISGIEPLAVRDPDEHARHLYPVFVNGDEIGMSRNEFDHELNAEGIQTSVHYIPIHHHSVFQNIERVNLSTTDRRARELLCLPLHPGMSTRDAEHIITAVEKIINH